MSKTSTENKFNLPEVEPINHKWSTLIKQVDGMCWTMDVGPGAAIPDAGDIVAIIPFLPNGERDNGTVYNTVMTLTTEAIDDSCGYSPDLDDIPCDLEEDLQF